MFLLGGTPAEGAGCGRGIEGSQVGGMPNEWIQPLKKAWNGIIHYLAVLNSWDACRMNEYIESGVVKKSGELVEVEETRVVRS